MCDDFEHVFEGMDPDVRDAVDREVDATAQQIAVEERHHDRRERLRRQANDRMRRQSENDR